MSLLQGINELTDKHAVKIKTLQEIIKSGSNFGSKREKADVCKASREE